jgi:hypothetical protein
VRPGRVRLDEDEFHPPLRDADQSRDRRAYVFSSGKNMGAFKAVGYPEDVGPSIAGGVQGFLWTAHGRFRPIPWMWGGRAPFYDSGLVDRPQREISSYDPTGAISKCSGTTAPSAPIRGHTYLFDFFVRKENSAPDLLGHSRSPDVERDRADGAGRNATTRPCARSIPAP